MNKDYYKTLGVDKGASADEIKSAFRKLAHQYHPDKGGGNEQKFKEVSEAYSVLGDANKRKQYDNFGSSFGGNQGGYSGGFGGQGGFSGFEGFDFSQFTQGGNGQGFEFDLGDILGDFFGGGRRVRRGRDVSLDIEITFKESIFGLNRKISLNTNRVKQKDLEIHIPAGIENGQRIRMTEMGETVEGGVPGDLYINIHVRPDPVFQRAGRDLVMTLNVKLTDAILGAKYPVKTLDGDIDLKIPEGVTYGEILRVRGKGVPKTNGSRGDLLIKINIVTPAHLSKQSRKLIEELKKEGI
ncbi:MAG: J domain-containing protein [Candidatus Paceibacterota bacterium]